MTQESESEGGLEKVELSQAEVCANKVSHQITDNDWESAKNVPDDPDLTWA